MLQVVIKGITLSSAGCLNIFGKAGDAFTVRLEYIEESIARGLLRLVGSEEVALEPQVFEDIEKAGRAYLAEKDAISLLHKKAQYRQGLKAKLLDKGHELRAVEQALDYLERVGILDDIDFALCWLKRYCATHAYGRLRLQGELERRGVSPSAIAGALESYFRVVSEEDLCLKAYNKCIRLHSDTEDIKRCLTAAGFTPKLVNRVITRE